MNLDWNINSKELPNIFEQTKIIPLDEKADIFDKIKIFEVLINYLRR